MRPSPDHGTSRFRDAAALDPDESGGTGRGEHGWLEGAPGVAIEVVGDTQSIATTMTKGLEYLGAGSRRVWLVDSEARRGEDVLPGFRCRVAELFE